ncbi:MAG: S53 family peptidase [Terriglobales bacterium]
MLRVRQVALSLSVFSTLIFMSVAQAQNGRPILITQNVDESKLSILAGNTRPEANRQNDRGPVADDFPMTHMLLQLKRSPEQERALQQFIQQQQEPSSPNFHHWLTSQQFGLRFGLASQDLNVITRWLEAHGFKVNVVYANGLLIDFSGTAGQVRAAFHTEIHQLDVKGVEHIANMSDPKIPAALSPAVVGVVSLHDFRPHGMYRPRSNYTFTSGGYPYYAIVPGDLATIYNLTPLFSASISGQGQTIVVVEDTDVYSTADWNTFRSTFGLSSYAGGSFSQVHPAPPHGTNNCTDPGTNGDDGEAILDAEYASAAAPSAAIELASCSNTETTFGGLIAIQNLLNESNTPPAVMSMSYGECEAGNGASANAAYSAAFQQAVTEGVSVFVSSGDEGAASCNADEANATYGIGVSGFASTPYNVAVGGTDFGDTYAGTNSTYWSSTNSATYASALSYVPEIPWNDSCASQLLSSYAGFSQPYGTSGFCNSTNGEKYFLTTASGSGGPSGCATGAPSVAGVVGGTCAGWPKPSWQSLVGNPSDAVRDIPDVSLFAANGLWEHYYPFCWSDIANGGASCTGAPDTWAGGGGTSFASPIMAGIQALVNQNAGGPQGNPNPIYYTIAASEYGSGGDSSCNSTLGNAADSSCVFYDVTLGDMDVNCSGSHNCYLPSGTYGVLSTSNSAYDIAYGTTTGWDFATGIGTVNAYNLVLAWAAAVPDLTITSTGSSSLTISAGETTPASYAFTIAPAAPATTFANNVVLSCGFTPSDPTLSCAFSPSNTIQAGAGASSVTMSISTKGPNQGSNLRTRQRADNRSPDHRLPWFPMTLPIAGVLVAGFAGRKISKYSMVGSLCLALVMAGLLVACGGSSAPPISVSNVAANPTSLYPNDAADGWPSQTAQFSATVSNDSSNSGVTWAVSTANGGTIDPTGLYTAPTVAEGLPSSVIVTATSVKDPSKSATGTITLTPATVPNTYTVTVTGKEGLNTHTQTVQLVVQ